MEDLDKKYQHNGFKVPENYFGDFDDKVFARIRDHKEQTAPVVLRVSKKPPAWLAAASIALLSAIAYIAYQTVPPASHEAISFDNLDVNELMEYENDVELSEDEFEEIIPAYTIDSLYHAEILPAGNFEYNAEELLNLEEEFSALDEEIEI